MIAPDVPIAQIELQAVLTDGHKGTDKCDNLSHHRLMQILLDRNKPPMHQQLHLMSQLHELNRRLCWRGDRCT
jgi:hypothetical protein